MRQAPAKAHNHSLVRAGRQREDLSALSSTVDERRRGGRVDVQGALARGDRGGTRFARVVQVVAAAAASERRRWAAQRRRAALH